MIAVNVAEKKFDPNTEQRPSAGPTEQKNVKTLSSILNAISGVIVIRGNTDRNVRAIRYDSRQVKKGDLFVAVNGPDDRALGFVDDAVEAGAEVVVLDDPAHLPKKSGSTTFVLVRDARGAMAEASAFMFDYPARSLEVYGVTGTNGKTTVAHVLAGLLNASGGRVGMIGTFGKTIDGVTTPTGYTTPEAPELMEIFAEMREAGIGKVVMEVSSHALTLKRVAGVRFAGAIFTNITQDHLDFHTSFQDYFNAKKILFDKLDANATAVVNIDDVHGAGMARDSHARIVRYGHDQNADLRIGDVHLRHDASSWIVSLAGRPEGKSMELRSRLLGGFNVANVTAACGMAVAAGVAPESLPDLVAAVEPVPGRMETIPLHNGAVAIVDYAHTPDALENLLQTVREFLDGGRLLLVFGCGGNRDRAKRPLMGEIAARLADCVVLTSDNPRTEDPELIIDEIEAGIAAAGEEARGKTERLTDRREAIAAALREARPGDAVVIAGKGHETYQIVGREQLPFDDRLVIREWIRETGISDTAN